MSMKIKLVRSDMGDGGWSLHPAGYDDKDFAAGNVPVLVSGIAEWDDALGEWDRPNEADYAAAEKKLAELGK